MSEQILFKKYQVLKVISNSKYSTVYLAAHIKLQCNRIIKQIYKASPCYLQLIGEAKIMKLLKHPCIPQVYDIEEDETSFYIVEQYMEGESLKRICQIRKLQEKTILSYSIQICDLLRYLHTREQVILYLDLKPENILIHNEQVYLVDFGSSNYRKEERDYGFGTPWFASPEQYLSKHVDERADVYGIGMLLYYMILGEEYAIKKGKNIDFSNSCSKELKRVVNKCLKLQAFQRYTSIMELQKSLSGIHTKLKNDKYKEHITTIAIAGSQHRMGVTHVSLQMANYLRQNRRASLYLECNDSLALSAIARRGNMKNYREEGYLLYQVPCCNYDLIKDRNLDTQYKFIIKDYGVLSNENYHEFCKADYQMVVMGAKDWELDASEQCIQLCKLQNNIYYLFNFINASDFLTVINNMKSKKCYRIPFEPHLILNDKSGVMEAFFLHLLEDILTGK